MPRPTRIGPLFCVCATRKIGRDKRFRPGIFGKLLAPFDRRQLDAIVQRHDDEAYDTHFSGQAHRLVLIFAQFSAAESLRGPEGWTANSQHHDHLAGGRPARANMALEPMARCRPRTALRFAGEGRRGGGAATPASPRLRATPD